MAIQPLVLLLSLLWVFIPLTSASGRGLIGYGIEMYNPSCAFACRSIIGAAPLSCSDHTEHTAGHHGPSTPFSTSPECRANDVSFLTTLALCMNTTCEANTPPALLEKYWASTATGDPATVPMWSYGRTVVETGSLLQDGQTPREYNTTAGDTLNFTASLNRESWTTTRNTLVNFERGEAIHTRASYVFHPSLVTVADTHICYRLIVVSVGLATPVGVTILSRLPFTSTLLTRLRPYLVFPSTIGRYNIRPLPYHLGNPPTLGQAWYIALMFLVNIVFSATWYKSVQPNNFFTNRYVEILSNFGNRTGAISFALLPLTMLFSGRNNFLLWITDWPHSTYILLHRWIARLFVIQVILHSIAELVAYVYKGEYSAALVTEWWIWGAVGTVAASAMVVFSILWIRRKAYEFFLISHIILAVFVLVGSWYHVEILFEKHWGYEIWMYAAFAVWAFDRVFRVLRILKVGLKKAKVIDLGGVVRVDVADVAWPAEPGMHSYIHFPGVIPWRPWENHPFSVIPTEMLRSHSHTISADHSDEEKISASKSSSHSLSGRPTRGVTFFVKKSLGLTSHLQKYATNNSAVRVLLDGPYKSRPLKEMLVSDRLVLIGGGIGITAILPLAKVHHNVKLYWSVKNDAAGLIREIEPTTYLIREKEIRIGDRLNVEEILRREADEGWGTVAVVVCGPGGMCDDVRAVVSKLGRERKTTFKLEVEAFSW